MRANTVEVEGLFDKDTRYLVPIFQRNYKWNREEQWEPLWVDRTSSGYRCPGPGRTGDP